MLCTGKIEAKYVTLPKTSKEFDDMLNEFSEEHQHRGIATVSPKKKRRRHAHSVSRDSSCEDRKRRHKRSRRESDIVKGKSDEDLFRPHRLPPESTGGKTRIVSVLETSAVSECEDEKSGAPQCSVAVSEEEVITTPPAQYKTSATTKALVSQHDVTRYIRKSNVSSRYTGCA